MSFRNEKQVRLEDKLRGSLFDRQLLEAAFINPFRVEPVDDEDDEDDFLEEKTLYHGWQPVSDELDDSEDAGRISLESTKGKKKKRKKKKKRPLSWYIGGAQPFTDISGGAGGGDAG